MIVKRRWHSKMKTTRTADGWLVSDYKYHYTGWFLFGIIPLYIVREG